MFGLKLGSKREIYNTMKKIYSLLIIVCLITTIIAKQDAKAGIPVTCINCSNMFTQILEYANDIESLMEGIKRYEELATHTTQNYNKISGDIKRYENMLKNTKSLPDNMNTKLAIKLKYLTNDIKSTGVRYADFAALQDIFSQLYPDYQSVAKSINPNLSSKLTRKYTEDHYDTWAKEAQSVTGKAFSMSGDQLNDLVESGGFEDAVNDLISTPEGQKEALDASNQLAAMQLEEARNLRALLAVSIQAQQQVAQKQQGIEYIQEQQSRNFWETREPTQTLNLPHGW
ncbi:P-type conjugative transfer protein TrbJ [Desulfotalea psychrophila]|nr:P-type conjugative transfer protein TrbJ [Desulfotalea psychrophila]